MGSATLEAIGAGLDHVRGAPSDAGIVRLIVRRPGVDRREILDEAELDLERGLVGDDWLDRGSVHAPDGSPARYAQVTLMNARFAALIAGAPAEWAKAGDQLYLDLDLSLANLPPGSEVALGTAVLRISPEPHTGCAKFSARFGSAALRVANSPEGRALRLRGANAMVVSPGVVRTGDAVRKL